MIGCNEGCTLLSINTCRRLFENVGRISSKWTHPVRIGESFNLGALPCYIILFPLRGISLITITSYQKK